MSLQQTSILAYRSLTNVKLGERQSQVLEALEEIQPATNRMISVKSGLPINVVTPRMNELRKKGKVTQDYVGIDVGADQLSIGKQYKQELAPPTGRDKAP